MYFTTTTILATLLTLTPLASACLEFTGTLHTQIPRKMVGTLIDNGVEVCKVDKFIDSQPGSAWVQFTCMPGHTAYIQSDGSRIGYLYGTQNFEFGVNEGAHGKGTPQNARDRKELWAKNYGC